MVTVINPILQTRKLRFTHSAAKATVRVQARFSTDTQLQSPQVKLPGVMCGRLASGRIPAGFCPILTWDWLFWRRLKRDVRGATRGAQSWTTQLVVVLHWVCAVRAASHPFGSREQRLSTNQPFWLRQVQGLWPWHKPLRRRARPSVGPHGEDAPLAAGLLHLYHLQAL